MRRDLEHATEGGRSGAVHARAMRIVKMFHAGKSCARCPSAATNHTSTGEWLCRPHYDDDRWQQLLAQRESMRRR